MHKKAMSVVSQDVTPSWIRDTVSCPLNRVPLPVAAGEVAVHHWQVSSSLSSLWTPACHTPIL